MYSEKIRYIFAKPLIQLLVENQNFGQRKTDVVFSKRIKAGRRRTYFFDVRATRGNDYYLTITESKKRPDDTYEKHKIFLYKEDFNKFLAGLNDAVNHVKTDLMPDFDFSQFDRPEYRDDQGEGYRNEGNQSYGSTEADPTDSAPADRYDSHSQQSGDAGSGSGDDDMKW